MTTATFYDFILVLISCQCLQIVYLKLSHDTCMIIEEKGSLEAGERGVGHRSWEDRNEEVELLLDLEN